MFTQLCAFDDSATVAATMTSSSQVIRDSSLSHYLLSYIQREHEQENLQMFYNSNSFVNINEY